MDEKQYLYSPHLSELHAWSESRVYSVSTHEKFLKLQFYKYFHEILNMHTFVSLQTLYEWVVSVRVSACSGSRRAEAQPSCHRVGGRVHPGQDASLSHGHTEEGKPAHSCTQANSKSLFFNLTCTCFYCRRNQEHIHMWKTWKLHTERPQATLELGIFLLRGNSANHHWCVNVCFKSRSPEHGHLNWMRLVDSSVLVSILGYEWCSCLCVEFSGNTFKKRLLALMVYSVNGNFYCKLYVRESPLGLNLYDTC